MPSSRSIWRQINQELSDNGKTFEDEGTSEEAAREDYLKLAERRVRLGLVLSKIGENAGIQVSDEELQRSLFEQVRKFPGQEQEIYEYFPEDPWGRCFPACPDL
jgi:trigger factor